MKIKMSLKNRKLRAVSLIESLLVLALMSILIAFSFKGFERMLEDFLWDETKASIRKSFEEAQGLALITTEPVYFRQLKKSNAFALLNRENKKIRNIYLASFIEVDDQEASSWEKVYYPNLQYSKMMKITINNHLLDRSIPIKVHLGGRVNLGKEDKISHTGGDEHWTIYHEFYHLFDAWSTTRSDFANP